MMTEIPLTFSMLKMLTHKTNLTSPPSQQSERSCICMLRVSILPFFMILIFDFGIVTTVWYFPLFYFIMSTVGVAVGDYDESIAIDNSCL